MAVIRSDLEGAWRKVDVRTEVPVSLKGVAVAAGIAGLYFSSKFVAEACGSPLLAPLSLGPSNRRLVAVLYASTVSISLGVLAAKKFPNDDTGGRYSLGILVGIYGGIWTFQHARCFYEPLQNPVTGLGKLFLLGTVPLPAVSIYYSVMGLAGFGCRYWSDSPENLKRQQFFAQLDGESWTEVPEARLAECWKNLSFEKKIKLVGKLSDDQILGLYCEQISLEYFSAKEFSDVRYASTLERNRKKALATLASRAFFPGGGLESSECQRLAFDYPDKWAKVRSQPRLNCNLIQAFDFLDWIARHNDADGLLGEPGELERWLPKLSDYLLSEPCFRLSDNRILELSRTTDPTRFLHKTNCRARSLAYLAHAAFGGGDAAQALQSAECQQVAIEHPDALSKVQEACQDQEGLAEAFAFLSWIAEKCTDNVTQMFPRLCPPLRKVWLEKVLEPRDIAAIRKQLTPDEKEYLSVSVCKVLEVLSTENVRELRQRLAHRNILALVRANPELLCLCERVCEEHPDENLCVELGGLRAAAWGIQDPKWLSSEPDLVITVEPSEEGQFLPVELRVHQAALQEGGGEASFFAALQHFTPEGGKKETSNATIKMDTEEERDRVVAFIQTVANLERPSFQWLVENAELLGNYPSARLSGLLHTYLLSAKNREMVPDEDLFAIVFGHLAAGEIPDDVKAYWGEIQVNDSNWKVALAYGTRVENEDLTKVVIDHVFTHGDPKDLQILWTAVEGEPDLEDIVRAQLKNRSEWYVTAWDESHPFPLSLVDNDSFNVIESLSDFCGQKLFWIMWKRADSENDEIVTQACLQLIQKHPRWVIKSADSMDSVPEMLLCKAARHCSESDVKDAKEFRRLWDAVAKIKDGQQAKEHLIELAKTNPEWISQAWTQFLEMPEELVPFMPS